MYTIIICALLSGGIFFFIKKNSFDSWLVGIAGAFLGMLIAALLPAIISDRSETSVDKKIMSLDDSTIIDGTFFLGTGSLSNDMKYFMYIKEKDDGIHMTNVPVSTTVIYEQSELKNVGTLRIYKKDLPRSLQLWALYKRKDYRYEIFVPKGTVVKQMKLDLQ